MKQFCEVSALYMRIGQKMNGVLYTPRPSRQRVGVLVMHSDSDYLNSPLGVGLAERGFLTLCANVQQPGAPLEARLPDVKMAMAALRQQPGIDCVVLLGHSGGATLMSCYEAVAENGVGIFQDDHRIVKMGAVEPLPPADGMLLIDSNFGNGIMTLVSIDPAVQADTCGMVQSGDYDPMAPESGYADGAACYTPEFRRTFFAAQAKRQEQLMEKALHRLEALNAGTGNFVDDEPFIVAGASQIAPNNKLFPQDLHLLAHTQDAYALLHADGSVTHQVIPSVRTARPGIRASRINALGTLVTTVRTYLSSNCVRTTQEYTVTETGIAGIDYDSAYCCTPGNVRHVRLPMLIVGMTGGYECIASEVIYRNAASRDKTIAFVEGGTHMLGTAKDAEQYPGQFGDAAQTLFDRIAAWLNEKF